MAALAGPATADPFDRSPRDVGIAVNDRLRSAGLDLRFELERCSGRDMMECRFSSAHSRDGDRWLHTIMITRSGDRDHCQR
jgi:hypothetical protein